MKDMMEYELEDGSTVYVEIEGSEAGDGMQRVSRSGERGERVTRRFSEAIAHIKPAAEMVLNAFREMNTPDEVGMEFGLKFNAKVGTAIFASVDSEATFKVSLKWTNKAQG